MISIILNTTTNTHVSFIPIPFTNKSYLKIIKIFRLILFLLAGAGPAQFDGSPEAAKLGDYGPQNRQLSVLDGQPGGLPGCGPRRHPRGAVRSRNGLRQGDWARPRQQTTFR